MPVQCWTNVLSIALAYLRFFRVPKECLMTTIAKGAKCATLINVFTVEPAKQQRLVDILVEATESTMRSLPGFISANIHKSLDGTRVANYAQWRSVEDFQAMLKNPEA